MKDISKQGYTTESDICKYLMQYYNYGESGAKRLIKVNVPEILDKYDLVRIKSNKELKEKYTVKSKGYPYIIIPN